MSEQRKYRRFSSLQRFEHIVLIIAFLGLALTGLPQRFADEEWSKTMIDVLGGIESARVIHRILALLLVAEAIYHMLAVGFALVVSGYRATLLPNQKDLRDGGNWLLFNLGMRSKRPKMPFFNFADKWDYWFFALGILLMIITGFLMWNPVAATEFLPGEVIPSARLIHSNEAILLLIGVLTWHSYRAIANGNFSIFTGQVSHKLMEEEHGQAVEVPESKQGTIRHAPEVIARRRPIYLVVAGALVVVVVVFLVWFVTFEDTAITTVPRREQADFLSPEDLGAEGDAEVGASLWPVLRCARCHGENARGNRNDIPALMGTNLSFEGVLLQVRTGHGDMPPISEEEVSDVYLLHVWTWLSQSEQNEE